MWGISTPVFLYGGFPGSSAGKKSTCNAGDPNLIPGSRRSPGEGIGYPLQYSWACPDGSLGKESAFSAGDLGSIPRLERSHGGGPGKSLLCSCLENPQGQRSLAGTSPWGPKELDTAKQLSTARHIILDCKWSLKERLKIMCKNGLRFRVL